jgi:hypothetical protein
MTVAELIDSAKAWQTARSSNLGAEGRRIVEASGARIADRLAHAVIDLLAEAQPCGMDAPEVVCAATGWIVMIPNDWCGGSYADEARSMARLLLRAADIADAKEPSRG